MKTIGIDPGNKQTAVVVWEAGRVVAAEKLPNDLVWNFMQRHALSQCEVACEHLQCYGMAVGAEVFETAYFIGLIWGWCRAMAIPFHRIYRSEVKMNLCHSMRAKDGNIRQALIDRFGPVGTKLNKGPLYGLAGDMWSALAVAVTFEDKTKL